MVIEKFSFLLAFLLTGCVVLSAQFPIQISDRSVTCQCNPDSTRFQVFRGQSPLASHELYGKYESDSSSITFTPIIPFMKSGQYLAICGGKVRIWTVPIPDDFVYGEVSAIYPTKSELPSNLLKFNIHFSKHMAVIAYDWIGLLDENGKEINRAFLTDIPELWNQAQTELTLWIEPGRIKRGLGPNEKLGPVLEAGRKYTLKISADIRDRDGVKLSKVFNKEFIAVEADRSRPKLENWKVEEVDLDGKVALKIDFGEVMDVASSSDAFYIPGVDGTWTIMPGETAILFEPKERMKRGSYKISVQPTIEDLAGNNLLRLFDVDLEEEVEVAPSDYTIDFTIKD